jgi:hypothetical protein
VEFGSSGHLDALAVAPLVWALAVVAPSAGHGWRSAPTSIRSWLASGALVGLSIGAKLLGGIALAPLAVWALWPDGVRRSAGRAGGIARAGALFAGAAATLVMTFTPYFTSVVFEQGGGFSTAMATYARKWQWNDGLYGVALVAEKDALSAAGGVGEPSPSWRFDSLAGAFRAAGMTHQHEGQTVASTTFDLAETAASVVKLLAALVVALLMLVLLHQRYEPLTVVTVLVAAILLLSPVVHPWYVAWLVPLAAACRSGTLMLWSGLVLLSYLPGFADSTGLRLLEYGPVLALGAGELWWRLGPRAHELERGRRARFSAIVPGPQNHRQKFPGRR